MFKINTARTYPYPVSVTIIDENGQGQTGSFTATFKILPRQETLPNNLLEHVLVKIDGLELTDGDGSVLEGEAMLAAAQKDPAISSALLHAYTESVLKKNQPKG